MSPCGGFLGASTTGTAASYSKPVSSVEVSLDLAERAADGGKRLVPGAGAFDVDDGLGGQRGILAERIARLVLGRISRRRRGRCCGGGRCSRRGSGWRLRSGLRQGLSH